MPVLPFHRYIGPGNPIDSGPCVDDDDCIAKRHDDKYERARTPGDVRSADVEAINEFRANWLAGNWHSLIGDIGLSLKYCIETYTGVLYPNGLIDYPPCQMVSLFHDFLRLHCVHKARPSVHYHNPLLAQQNIQGKTYDFTKPLISDEIYFFVLVAWYQLYRKDLQKQVNNENIILNNPKTKIPKQRNTHLVQNCDIFHLKAWMRFFTMFQANKVLVPSDDYNDEEFSNMFMQYD